MLKLKMCEHDDCFTCPYDDCKFEKTKLKRTNRKEYYHQYYMENKETISNKRREYYLKHKEEIAKKRYKALILSLCVNIR